MSRRVNKIASQTDATDVVSALSEVAGSTSSSAPIRATRGASAALLAKEVPSMPVPVATSSAGLGFRSFSPVASNAVPPASSSLFLTEDGLPPSNQLEISQIVPETMLPSQPGAMILPEVTLPLTAQQVNTAYSLLRTLRLFCCENPGVLDTTSALVQLPPVGDAQSPYQVPPPPPVWPVEYAQSPVGIRYCNTFGGRYIKERDMDPSLPKKDRGASMQRKRSRLVDFAGLSGKSLGSERSVSRSRD